MRSNDSKTPPPRPQRTALDWVRYSGASLVVTVNPLHWRWMPRITTRDTDAWQGPNERHFYLSWLMLTLRIWIDDGAW